MIIPYAISAANAPMMIAPYMTRSRSGAVGRVRSLVMKSRNLPLGISLPMSQANGQRNSRYAIAKRNGLRSALHCHGSIEYGLSRDQVALFGVRRLGEGSRNWPSLMKNPAPDRCAVNAGDFSPLRYRKGALPENDNSVVPAIAGIGFGICPSTILRRVSAVVVDPVQLMVGCGSSSHVPDKRRKGLAPAFTNCDATSSVTGVGGALGIEASLLEPLPHRVFRHIQVRRSRAAGRWPHVVLEATARLSVSGHQVIPRNGPKRSAIAQALKHFAAPRRNNAESNEPRKPFAYQTFSHRGLYKMRGYCGG